MSEKYEGTLTETEEAEPFWCERDRIPYEKMWEDDKLWLEDALNGKKITGRFIFDEEKMISYKLIP